MELSRIPGHHPLKQRLHTLSERLDSQTDQVVQLKQKIVQRLLAWDQNIEATKFDAVGTFVVEGVRERLQALLPDEIADCITIRSHGWVTLCDQPEAPEEDTLIIGSIHVPYDDEWAQQHFVNRNCVSNVERMTFTPRDCNRYTDPQAATLDSAGAFQFTETDAQAARIAMGADYVRAYVHIAFDIHTNEAAGSYRNARTQGNLDCALEACSWLERSLPAPLENQSGKERNIEGG